MLQVAYIQGKEPEKIKKVTAKQAHHNRMLEELDQQYSVDAIKARKKYASQIAEIEALEKELKRLKAS